jgi:hypothetical protein
MVYRLPQQYLSINNNNNNNNNNNWVRLFGPKRDEVMVGWHNGITRSFVICTLPSIITMTKSRRMKLAGLLARTGRKTHIGYWWESQREGITKKTKT